MRREDGVSTVEDGIHPASWHYGVGVFTFVMETLQHTVYDMVYDATLLLLHQKD